MTLDDVILRHRGESQKSRDAYAALPSWQSAALQAFLNSLVLFPPDDTPSTLDPAVPAKTNFPRSTITEVSSSPYSSTIRPIWNDRREIPQPRVPILARSVAQGWDSTTPSSLLFQRQNP